MSDLTRLTLKDALDGLRARRFSSVEITKAHLSVMEKARALNAFVLETPETALAMAARADSRIAASSTVLAIGPAWSSEEAKATMPQREQRP